MLRFLVRDILFEIIMQEENSLNEIFSLRLSKAIADKSFTQREVSLLTGIAQSAISKYLSGKGLPRTAELYKLAKILGVSMDYLCGLREAGPVTNSKILYEDNIGLISSLSFALDTLEGAMGSLRKRLAQYSSYLSNADDRLPAPRVAEDDV